MPPKAFRENVVVITGGSAGIGHELAYQLALQGAWLVLAAREANLIEDTALEARNRGARAVAVPTDVAVEAQCEALIDRAL